MSPELATVSRAPLPSDPGSALASKSDSERDLVDLMGLELDRVTERQAVESVFDALDTGVGGWIVTPNLDILRRHTRDEETRQLISLATLVVADGMPLIWASRLKGDPLPERVAGSTMIWTLCREAAHRGRSVFLLGGNEGAAADASRVLERACPGIRIVGAHCPPFGFENDADAMNAIRDQLEAARPDLVFVALGSPKQERLIKEMRELLPSAWWAGVGISLSFISGEVRRAPRWMQKTGLEWFHRFMQEPGRLARRYFVEGVPFAIRLFAVSALSRFGRTRSKSL